MIKATRDGRCGYCGKPIVAGQSIALDEDDPEGRGWGHADCAIVRLVDEGYARWRIAELLDMPESDVRRVIRDLCSRFGVPMAELPKVFLSAATDMEVGQ